jgi:hypothetical protein
MLHLLIAGSRNYRDWETFERVTREIIGEEKEIVIVEGGASGADSMAKRFALENGLEVQEFKPDWKRYGRAAGLKRNDAMTAFIKEKNGRALYFWDEESKGTKQCIQSARKNDIGLLVWSTKQNKFLQEYAEKEEAKMETNGKWIVFNRDEPELLFEECSECGHEINGEYLIVAMMNSKRVNIDECPKCRARMRSWVFAEEVDDGR